MRQIYHRGQPAIVAAIAPPPSRARPSPGVQSTSERGASRSTAGGAVLRRPEAKCAASGHNSGHSSRGAIGGGAQRHPIARGAAIERGDGALPVARCKNGDASAVNEPGTDTPRTRQLAAHRPRRRSPHSHRPPRPRPRRRRRATRTLKIDQNASISLDFAHFHWTPRRRFDEPRANGPGPRAQALTASRTPPPPSRTAARTHASGIVAFRRRRPSGARRCEFRRWGAGTAEPRRRARFLRTAQCSPVPPRCQKRAATTLNFAQIDVGRF